MQNQTTRMQSELDSLRQELKTASAEEKNQIENQIKRLEADIDNLEQQQTNLAQANLEGLEQIERVINEWLETQQLDRSVRGEGTSLDGPELNRTGTRTGTEVESQVPLELEDENTQSTVVPPGP
jgi:molecular chaperone GrpE (heat shock protein)